MALLEVDDIHTYYGNIEALKGISLDGRGGRDRHADRLQRRRQVDDAALDLGAHAAARGHDPLRRRGDRARSPPQEIVQLGISQSPEGRHCFPRMTVRENLDLGAYLRRDERDRRGPRARLRAVPAPQGARAPEGGHDVRRRAADARHRPRADGPARSCCCSTSRRWASRRSSSSASTRRSPRSTSRARRSCSSSRTRTSRSSVSQARLRARDRRGRADRRVGRAARRTPRSRRPTWAHDRPRRSSAPRRCTCCTSGWPRRSWAPGCPSARATARSPAWPPACC